MSPRVCALWRGQPSDLIVRTRRCIDDACANSSAENPGYIFFRNDDVAVPGKQFVQLMELFYQLHVPLNLAIVPAWLTAVRWLSILSQRHSAADLWCWHQHGWRHKNHEIGGEKQEFGPGRSAAAIKQDLSLGRRRLVDIIGERYFPVFTPPWNRCDARTLRLLKKQGYVAVSRSQNPKLSMLKGLPDFGVNVDLHTRKERTSASGWINFFAELKKGISSGLCGIMIHHNRMNAAAFDFLEALLKILVAHKNLQLVQFRDLARIKKDFRCQVSGVRKKQGVSRQI